MHLSASVQLPEYEETEKLCNRCGRFFRGLHWTKPPCVSQRREFIFDGRVLGWCGPCIHAEEERQRRIEEAERHRREGQQITRIERPRRAGDYDDAPPF